VVNGNYLQLHFSSIPCLWPKRSYVTFVTAAAISVFSV